MSKEGQYKIDLPVLSNTEEKIVILVGELFRTKTRESDIDWKASENMKKIVIQAASEGGYYLNKNQIEYLSEMAIHHICGYAFIDKLLLDQNIEEISIIGINKPAYVYIKNEGWKSVNAFFLNEGMLFDIINKMGQQLGKHITLQNPRLDTILPDGSRLHASLSPISGGEITIRKFRSEPYSLGELVKNETIEPKVAALLSLLMQNDHSIVVGGNTASGKTTTLNSLFSFVSQRERIIITEETPEINIPHPHQLRLVANRDLQIDLEGLVHDTMRMRPDRLIVGEIRKQDEFEALFEVLLSGQARGSYATMHAQSGIEALARMKNMGVSPTDLESIDCIIIQKRMQKYDPINKRNNEVRRIVEIAEVEEEMAKTIYRLGEVDEIYQSSIFTKICSEFSMDKNQMIDYLKQRQTIIMPNNENYLEYHKRIQRELFDD